MLRHRASALEPQDASLRRIDPRSSLFVDLQHPLTILGIFRIAFMAPLILARAVTIICCLAVVAVIGRLSIIGFPVDSQPLEHTSWRRKLLLTSRPFVRLILVALGFWRVPVHGWEHYLEAHRRNEPYIGIFNHVRAHPAGT